MKRACWLLIGLVGCFPELTLPNGAVLQCTDDGDCPASMLCRGTPSVCIDAKEASEPAPSLVGAALVAPAVGTIGTTFSVTFEVDRDVRTDPVVHLDAGSRTAPLLIDEAASDRAQHTFVYTYTADGSELSGARPVVVDLDGVNGNNARGLSAGTVQLDFAPPQLAGSPTITPSLVSSAATLTASFTITEDTSELPEVWMESVGGTPLPFTVAPDSAPRSFIASYVPVGDEPQVEHTLFMVATDVAGNASPSLLLGKVALDFVAPSPVTADVRYTRDVGNPLFSVAAMRNGTRVAVTFDTSEPLAAVPTVTARCADDVVLSLSRRAAETSTSFFTYELTLGVAHVVDDGACVLSALLTDAAGNMRDSDLLGARLDIDRTQPGALSEAALAELVHVRVPWGATRTEGLAGQYLASSAVGDEHPLAVDIDAAAFAFDDETIVEARVYSNAALNQLVGIVEPSEEGFSPLQLLGVDVPGIWVTRLDHAGNESPAVRVPTVRWVATLGNKVPYSTLENPNRLVSVPRFGAALTQDLATEAGAASGVANVGGASLQTVGQASLTRFQGSNVPFMPSTTMAAYDRRRDVIVLQTQSTFEFRDNWYAPTIVDPELDGVPGQLTGMVYDERRGVVVGLDASASRMWDWNGKSWASTDVENTPFGRAGAALVYDSKRGRLVLFGGWSGSSLHRDTWVFDGGTWTELCKAADGCVTPPARWLAGSAYDRDRDRVVLFGGSSTTGCLYCADTWEFDGEEWYLAQAADLAGQPAPRASLSMAYDEERKRVVQFGGHYPFGTCAGSGGSINACHETWTWNGSTWTLVQPYDLYGNGRQPLARSYARMVYDNVRQRVVMLGGDGGLTDSFWAWDGHAWRDIALSAAHPAGGGFNSLLGGGYDPVRRLAMFVDQGMHVWEFNGTAWRQLCDGVPAEDVCTMPTVRSNASVAFDVSRGRLVVFGGMYDEAPLDDLLEFDGVDWIDRTVAATSTDSRPAPRMQAAMAYDPARDAVVLFGGTVFENGTNFNDTWTLEAGVWHAQEPSQTPDARWQSRLVFDALDQQLLLFGGMSVDTCDGNDACDKVWAWNGDWSLTGAVLPHESVGVAFYEPVRQGITHIDTSLYEGSETFTPIVVANPLGEPRPEGSWTTSASVYLPNMERAVITSAEHEWLWNGGADERPGHLVHVSLANAGAEALTASLKRVELNARAAATGMALVPRTIVRLKDRGPAQTNLNAVYGAAQAPLESLGAFTAQPARRTWTLLIDDCCSGGTGTLTAFCIELEEGTHCAPGTTTLRDDALTSVPLELSNEDLADVSTLEVAVAITHPTAAQLSLALVGEPVVEDQVGGVELLVWQGAQWVSVASNTASTSSPSSAWPVGHALETAAFATSVIGATRDIDFAVVPRSRNGRDYATLVTDDVEVSIDYSVASEPD